MGRYAVNPESVDGTGMRIAVVVSRFNEAVTASLAEGACRVLEGRGVDPESILVVEVPGAFELPVTAKRLASSGQVDAVICLGAVIRGDTPHFDYVAGEAAAGINRAALDTGVPCVFGVLTTDTLDQARDRIGGAAGHKGEEAAATALEMVSLLRGLP